MGPPDPDSSKHPYPLSNTLANTTCSYGVLCCRNSQHTAAYSGACRWTSVHTTQQVTFCKHNAGAQHTVQNLYCSILLLPHSHQLQHAPKLATCNLPSPMAMNPMPTHAVKRHSKLTCCCCSWLSATAASLQPSQPCVH